MNDGGRFTIEGSNIPPDLRVPEPSKGGRCKQRSRCRDLTEAVGGGLRLDHSAKCPSEATATNIGIDIKLIDNTVRQDEGLANATTWPSTTPTNVIVFWIIAAAQRTLTGDAQGLDLRRAVFAARRQPNRSLVDSTDGVGVCR
ncbi:MAG: hypothetical protein QOF96_4112 [Actinomycetota bacterium]|nr:hypothetical protein [Actinomycetota bacterium]